MSNGFVNRGGLWVVGQSCLMLSVAVLATMDCSRFDPFPFQLSVAVSLFALAAVVGIAGVITLGRNRTPFPIPRSDSELVQRGIYSVIRHPLYAAVILWGFSWALFWRSWPALGAAALMAVFFDAKARHEERLLMNQFEGYAGYMSRVHRFVPWLY